MIMLSFEFAVLDGIQNHLRTSFLDAAMPLISRLGDAGIVWLLMTLVLVIMPVTIKIGLVVSVALAVVSLFCNVIAKPLVGRARPYDVNTAVHLLVKRLTDFSFPSGHTAASFAVVFALYFIGCKLWKFSLVLAVLIAFSRLYLYVHYPSDVLAGVFLGAAAARCAVCLSGLFVCA